MSSEDVEYYRARAAAERARAELAPSEKVESLHLQLAILYDDLSLKLTSGDLDQDVAPCLQIVPKGQSGRSS